MRILGSIFIIIALGIVGFVSFFFAVFSREAEFYVPFVITITLGVMVIIILGIYGQLKKKIYKVMAIIFLTLCTVLVVGHEGYQAYLKSIEVVSTQDVDLSEYRPFAENSKAVTLEEESTFKINDNLPTLDGATALFPVYSAFAQAVYPKKDYPLYDSEVVSSQTSHAFERLINGDVDIIFISHPSEGQMKAAERKGVKLNMTPIGREAFVFFVHSKNPVDELSVEQIKAIYSGEITNWNEVGGKNEEIRAFQRPEGSGSQSTLIKMMDGNELMDPPSEDIVSAMGGIIKETTNYRNQTNAIGFSFRYFSQEMVENGKIKYVAVDGIQPTKENIRNNTYPVIGEFYAITAGSDNPYIEEFIEWMKSEQGQKIVDQTGYVPVN